MPHPSFDDPIATAHHEADRRLPRGLPVRPTLIGFEQRRPTLYVRGRMPASDVDLDRVIPELLLLPMMLRIPQLMLISQVTMSDAMTDRFDEVDGAVRRSLDADRGIIVERVVRDAHGLVDGSGDALPYRIDDHGRCCWEEPIELPTGGPWAAVIGHRLSLDDADEVPDTLGPAEAAYALSRFGVTIAVAPTWRSRYGLDGPIAHRQVRREDRRRARDREARLVGSVRTTVPEVR